MIFGWLLLIATIGSSIWVFLDAPRHGLSRAWSVACLVIWTFAFPTYLVARAKADGRVSGRHGAGRGLRRWLSRRLARDQRVAVIALLVAVPLTVIGAWELRLLFRGPLMLFFVRHPALTSIPLLAGATAFLLHLSFKLARRALRRGESEGVPSEAARRSRKRGVRVASPRPERSRRYTVAEFVRGGWRGRGERPPPVAFGPAMSFVVCGVLGFAFAVTVTASWTGKAIYEHTDYGALSLDTLRGGEVRIKPYDVAQRQSQNGLNSPTERPTNLHIVKVDGRLLWTSVRDPEGFFRVLSRSTRGVMSVAADSSAPGVRQAGARYDADFRYGPGMRITDNIRWQVYKKMCFSCDVAEMTGVPTRSGPVVIAPYIRYEGNWFVRRPTFGGVYVVHADGRIEDLSPEEAARSALVRESGRLFPEKLARRLADAYKFRRGIWNRLFVHTEQLDVAHTERNPQPFLQDFERIGPQWVTTLKPRGRTFTTAGVMTTDAISGKTRVWLAPRGQSLLGNQRALDIVRGESFPGIVFSDDNSEREGDFRAVEPRQVFPGGRLQFLVTIIPGSSNRSTMSVIVDAQKQEVAAKFPASPAGDAELIKYLNTGRLEPEHSSGTGGEDTVGDGGENGAGSLPERRGAAATLRRLLEQNLEEQRRAGRRVADLKAQERDLRRLLRGAGGPR